MLRSHRILLISIVIATFSAALWFALPAKSQTSSNRWRITTIKVCRDYSGNIIPHMEALGSYPVYSFFVPRPVWTVNGIVVEAQPIYDRGRLISFKLMRAAPLLKTAARNTVKLSLPDQNTSKVFRYDDSKPTTGDCYEFF